VSERTLPSPLPRQGQAGRLLGRLVRGGAEQATWVRPAFWGILLLAGFLYIWGLDRNGYANSYYSAAVVAGTRSWKAFFFGSFDAGNFITVDKPPASLWLMELSGRLFGVNSWSLLLPEALLGVATVALVFLIVRRMAGPVAGLLAALVMALTPVAVSMFRFNNPDALLTFLLVAAAWALVRALRTGRTRWLLLSAAVVGLAFDTKYLQAYIVLPALVLTYFVLGPHGWLRRSWQLLAAAGALVLSSGWWVAIVELVPASARPFIGGSTDNSVLNLIFGYDGFGRLTGALGFGPRGGGGGGAGGGFGGQPGLLRLFNDQLGSEISWLLPLAAVALVAGLWVHRRAPRTDLARAGYVLWGLWLLTHAVVFSFAGGILHSYYTVAMAPAVAGLVGQGVVDLWRLASRSLVAGVLAGAALLATAWWGGQLLGRTPDFAPGLATAELALALLAALLLLVARWSRLSLPSRAWTRLPAVALAVGVVAVMLGPAAYAFATADRGIQGPTPSSGPSSAAGFGGGPGGQQLGRGAQGDLPAGVRAREFIPGEGAAPGGGLGGTASSALLKYLEEHQGNATWLVAVSSANEGASLELSTGRPVLVMGGFSGSDPAMTVAKLKQLVRSGKLRYVLVGGGPGGGGGVVEGVAAGPGGTLEGPPGATGFTPPGDGSAQQRPNSGTQSVLSWVTQHGKAVDYGGSSTGGGTLYDLSGAA
jgi:4-amino-4-deoxy-L-arabinose transferase-like glycosyltransferase